MERLASLALRPSGVVLAVAGELKRQHLCGSGSPSLPSTCTYFAHLVVDAPTGVAVAFAAPADSQLAHRVEGALLRRVVDGCRADVGEQIVHIIRRGQ